MSNSFEYTVIMLVGDYFAGQPCDLNQGEALFMHTSLTEITVDCINLLLLAARFAQSG
jgi:hypothetical protein